MAWELKKQYDAKPININIPEEQAERIEDEK